MKAHNKGLTEGQGSEVVPLISTAHTPYLFMPSDHPSASSRLLAGFVRAKIPIESHLRIIASMNLVAADDLICRSAVAVQSIQVLLRIT